MPGGLESWGRGRDPWESASPTSRQPTAGHRDTPHTWPSRPALGRGVSQEGHSSARRSTVPPRAPAPSCRSQAGKGVRE